MGADEDRGGYSPDLVAELFSAASDLPAGEREDFLERRCGEEAGLREAVERLLRAAEEAAGATRWRDPALVQAAREAAGETALPFERLGPYRILRRIGMGGMGAVYLGERDDDGVVRRAALKVVPYALQSPDAFRRFQQERRILAGLDHPNIARLLDAGRTADGLPYLAMEYVEGVRIDRYAEERHLTVKERIELVRVVCEAVSHAHAHLVVHRDLKPGNILVTAEGTPKLLDFGIAKLVSEAGEEAASTRILTAGYASPEQEAGRAVTTASDVYSLGVMLEELAGDGGRSGDLWTIVGKARQAEAERRYGSVAEFREDLGRYVAGYPVKARPDTLWYRARKFAGRRRIELAVAAVAMAAIAGEGAVTVREYRESARRFADTRNLVNSFLFEVSDAIADIPGTTAARRLLARRAQQYLDILARERSSDVGLERDLAMAYRKLGDVLGRPYTANLGDTAGAAADYGKSAGILEGLTARRPKDAAMARELGLVYLREGRLFSREMKSGEAVGASVKAAALLERAAELDPESTGIRRDLVGAYLNLNLALVWEDDRDKTARLAARAEEAARRALALTGPMLEAAPDDATLHYLASAGSDGLGYADGIRAKYLPDATYLRAVLRDQREAHREMETAYRLSPARYRREMADSWDSLANALLGTGDVGGAEAANRQELGIEEELVRGDRQNAEARRDLANGYANLGGILERRGRLADAEAAWRRALEIDEALQAHDPNSGEDLKRVLETRDALAAAAARGGDSGGALALYRRNMATLDGSGEPSLRAQLALDYGYAGETLAGRDRRGAAEWYGKALAVWESLRDAGQIPPAYLGKPAEVRRALMHLGRRDGEESLTARRAGVR